MASTIHDPWGLSLDPSANNGIATQQGGGAKPPAEDLYAKDYSKNYSTDPDLVLTGVGGGSGGGGGMQPINFDDIGDVGERNVDFAGNVKGLEDFYEPVGLMSQNPSKPLAMSRQVVAPDVRTGAGQNMAGMLQNQVVAPDARNPDYSGLQGGRKYWQNPDGSFTDKGQFEVSNQVVAPDVASQQTQAKPQMVQQAKPAGQMLALGLEEKNIGRIPSGDFPNDRARESQMNKSGRVAWGDENGDVTYLDNDPNDPRNFGVSGADSIGPTQGDIYKAAGIDLDSLPASSRQAVEGAYQEAEAVAVRRQSDLAALDLADKSLQEQEKMIKLEINNSPQNDKEKRDAQQFLDQYSPLGEVSPDKKARIARGIDKVMDAQRDLTDPNNAIAKLQQIQEREDSLKNGLSQIDAQKQENALRRKELMDLPITDPIESARMAFDLVSEKEAEAEQPTPSETRAANNYARKNIVNRLKLAEDGRGQEARDEAAKIKGELAEFDRRVSLGLRDVQPMGAVDGGKPVTVPPKPVSATTPTNKSRVALQSVASSALGPLGNAVGGMLDDKLFGNSEQAQDTAPRKAKIPQEYIGEFDAEVRKLVASGIPAAQAEDIVLKKGGL